MATGCAASALDRDSATLGGHGGFSDGDAITAARLTVTRLISNHTD